MGKDQLPASQLGGAAGRLRCCAARINIGPIRPPKMTKKYLIPVLKCVKEFFGWWQRDGDVSWLLLQFVTWPLCLVSRPWNAPSAVCTHSSSLSGPDCDLKPHHSDIDWVRWWWEMMWDSVEGGLAKKEGVEEKKSATKIQRCGKLSGSSPRCWSCFHPGPKLVPSFL